MADNPTNRERIDPVELPYVVREHGRRLTNVEQIVAPLPVIKRDVESLTEEVQGLRRALWGVAGSILVGVLTFALAVASGVIGG